MGREVGGGYSRVGQLETNLLEHFTTRERVECRGSNEEVCLQKHFFFIFSFLSQVLVWHTKTADPNLKHEFHYPSDTASVRV